MQAVTICLFAILISLGVYADPTPGSSCDELWSKAKEDSSSLLEKATSTLGLTENLWENLCLMKVNPECKLRMSVSKGLIQYTYHFTYNGEEIKIDNTENIETQKKCADLIASLEKKNEAE